MKKRLCLVCFTFCLVTVIVSAQPNIASQPLPALSLDSMRFSGLPKLLQDDIEGNKIFGIGATCFTMSEGIQLNNKIAQYLMLKANYKVLALPVEDWTLR